MTDLTASSSAVVIAHPAINGGASASSTTPKLIYFADCGIAASKHWIMKGIIARGETSGWIAPPGYGKSALLTEIAVHCAGGIDWRGHKAKEACGVVFLALERADLCMRRLHAYVVRNKLSGLPIAISSGIVDLMRETCVGKIAEIVHAAERHLGCDVGMIIIDTFNKGIAAGGGDEDKARDQNRVAANLRRVQELLNIHIALIGHTGKDETRGARGSNAYLGDVDVMVQISGNGVKTAEVTKGNDQPERVLTQFRLEVIRLGRDEDGDPITTAIVAADLVAEEPARQATREPRLTSDQKTMLAILRKAGHGGLTAEQWAEAARKAKIGIDRRADITDARNGLNNKGLVREFAGRWTVIN